MEGVNRQIFAELLEVFATSGSRRRAVRLEVAQPGSRLSPDPRAKARRPSKPPSRPAKGRCLVGQHGFVIGHRVH